MLWLATRQNRSACSSGTPMSAIVSRTAAKGSDWLRSRVSGHRSAASNFVGEAPNCDSSNPSASSSSVMRSSTGWFDPSRAISDSSASGATPCSRRSRRDSAPMRLDSSSPWAPVSRL